MATKKYLLDVPTSEITRFESEFFEFLDTQYPELVTSIADNKVISEDDEAKLIRAIEDFKKDFS